MNLSRCQVHAAHTPDLACHHPLVARGCSDETDVFTEIANRLTRAHRPHAIREQSDPDTVASLNSRADVKIQASVGAHPEIVHSRHSPRQPASPISRKRHVKARPLRRDLRLTREDRLHGYAVVGDARDIQIVLVDLLAVHRFPCPFFTSDLRFAPGSVNYTRMTGHSPGAPSSAPGAAISLLRCGMDLRRSARGAITDSNLRVY